MSIFHRGLRVVGSAVIAGAVTAATVGATDPKPKPVLHPSGIEILPPTELAVASAPQNLALALSVARQESEGAPDDLAYPYIDERAQQLVVVAVTAAGRALVNEIRGEVAKKLNVADQPTIVVRDASVSRRQIDTAMDALIGEQPEGIEVLSDHPDPEHGRLILEVSALNDAFLYRAARDHGAAMIAVQVSTNTAPHYPAARETDTSPFYGGANINGCTSAFSWHSGTTEMMLTAGHCFPTGGSAATPATSMGHVSSGSEESWKSGTGTVLMTGQTVNRGDIALVRINSGKYSAGSIYRGGPGASVSASVSGKWSRSPAKGDAYCTGGRVSGETCGWTVMWSAAGNYYYSGTKETARRVWYGEKKEQCIRGGDSGTRVHSKQRRKRGCQGHYQRRKYGR